MPIFHGTTTPGERAPRSMHDVQGSSIKTWKKSRLTKAQAQLELACAQQPPDQDRVKSRDMWLPSAVSTAQSSLAHSLKTCLQAGRLTAGLGMVIILWRVQGRQAASSD